MEAMALSPHAYPVTPRTSHIRSSSRVHRPAQDATLGMQQAEPQLSAPASQESFVSVQSSNGNGRTGLQSSSSNVSQLTQYTDLTSPISNGQAKGYGSQHAASTRHDIARRRTPEGANGTDDYAVASPMSLTSPASTNGAKRTASGHVKNALSLPNTPLTAPSNNGHHRSRTDSISSTSSRAGELAANLKTRLGYAMHKVQNGWEHKDINEVEKLVGERGYVGAGNGNSMSHLDQLRRPESAGVGNGVGVYEWYTNGFDGTRSPPPKRHSGISVSYTHL